VGTPSQSIAILTARRARFRTRPTLLLAYFGVLLLLELLAELWLANEVPAVRALSRWSLLVLAVVPLLGLLTWRGYQADLEFAAFAERDLIRKLALSLTAEYNPERIPQLIVRQTQELTAARAVLLARPAVAGYRVETVGGDTSSQLIGQILPIALDSPGICGQALRTGRPVVLPDTWCDAGLAARRELALSDKVRSAAVVPLSLGGEIVGLLGLHGDRIQQFTPELVTLLALYAEQAAGPYYSTQLAASVSQLDAAKQLDQLKTEFLSAVAHELQTPLSPILGWSELLLTREYAPNQARPLLQQIHEGAQHLSVLVNDLLDLSRGEAGRLALELDQLDLAELIEHAVARWREQAPSHNVVFATSGALPFRGDQHRLRQVLDNLLSNATKYSPPGTRVFITARGEPDGRVCARFSDQGIGLTPDEHDRLFTKFYRTETARKQASGTGLGLALCRLILEAHGGTIQVESDGHGCGSAFTLTLPVNGPAKETSQAASFATIRG
jgi:signal transduction histidine kinase